MPEPYLGEIRMTGFSFAPVGWAHCAGQLLPIAQNEALYNLIGTTYGGNGQTTFALPDLRGRVPLHAGDGITRATPGGTTSHTLTTEEMPGHSHSLQVSTTVSHYLDPTGKVLGSVEPGALNIYASGAANTALAEASIGMAGASQPHENIQPTTVINFIIALEGIYPFPE